MCVGGYLSRLTRGVGHHGLLTAPPQLRQAFGAVSVEQVLGAAGRGLGAAGVGDGGRCQAVLDVLVHVHSGGPRLPAAL